MIARLDLRLAPAALAVWLVTLLGIRAGWAPAAVVAAGSGLAVLPLLLMRGRAGARAALVVVLLVGVAAGATAVRAHAVERNPLRQAAERGESVTARVELTAAPRPLRGASFGASRAQDRALVTADLVAAETGGARVRAGGSVVLLVPTETWRGLIAGQRVTVSAEAVPPRAGELTVAMLPVHAAPGEVERAPGWQRVAARLRADLRELAEQRLGPEAAGLLPGLVVGDTAGISPEVRQDFETAGLAHLLAVSGANLAIVCGAALVLLRLLGSGPVLSATGAGLALLGFVGLAGPEPSVLRAAVMGAITLFALVLGRQRSALPVLSASVLVLLLTLPELATSAGFALSVAATAGLVLLAPAWAAALRERGVPVGLAEALAVPVAAHLVTAPLIAAISGEVSLVAVLANLLAAPVIGPATVLGVLATVIAPLSGWSAGLLVLLAGPELEWVLLLADRAAAVPGAAFAWPSGAGGGALLGVLLLIALVVLRGKRVRVLAAVAVLLTALVVVPVRAVLPGWPPPGWSLVTCDVGQGDALVLSTGRSGDAVVVDTGPDPRRAAGCLRRLGVERVSLIVLTHLHADHVSGLSSVLDELPVGAVALGPLREPRWAHEEVVREARRHGTPLRAVRAGQRMTWPGLVLDVLAPEAGSAGTQTAEDANDASVVLRATTPAGRMLLTGDIEPPAQGGLLAGGADLRAEVLKVPHHGSRYTTPRFLAQVRPRIALISVGAGNDYGHPSPVIVGALTRAGARVLRTDRRGDIAVLATGSGPLPRSRGDPSRETD
ncbi:DNA internalization-related competence protein ComEC/Rec2 [Saccharopolyspora griseoalba]|uniref:DNA internalization-related competence protein ComEC/Rec2 n=1 Tax=Saccharopolyspora griseoalba TaxID=1431848 RepID=A0ABW2LL25_9PSEU